MDVWDYFDSRERECEAQSLYPVSGSFAEMCFGEGYSDDSRGIWLGDLALTVKTYLKVSEQIFIGPDDRPHREEYSYYLIHGGVQMWGYDRDLSHPELIDHGHRGAAHTRVDCGERTFAAVVEEAWKTVSEEAHLEDAEALNE